jgi:carboxyl-terminal processing protease
MRNRLALAPRIAVVASFIFVSFGSATPASALTCQQVRQLTAVYLKMHYSFNNFDDELSTRTLDQFIKNWDPGKLYFYKSDVDSFKKDYDKKIDDQVMAANCEAINRIANVYSQRFEERNKEIKRLIELPHVFNVDEYMDIDRKTIDFASTSEELSERWRKRIKFQLLQLNKTIKDLKKSREKLQKRFELAEKREKEETKDTVFASFLNAFSLSLDPHSEYMSPDTLEDFRIQTRLSLEGIGAVLKSEDGFTVIQSLVTGGAAFKSGKIKVDDKITAVSQEKGEPVDVIDMDLREVVKLIRGTVGTTVKLTIVREGTGKTSQLVVPIVREKIQLTDRVAKSKVVPVEVNTGEGKPTTLKIGVLNLPSFYIDFEGQHNKVQNYRSSATDVQKEIEKLRAQKIDAMVVDLRTNGGGSLTESIKIAGFFFDKGPVVQVKESDGNVFPQADNDGLTFYDGPMAVLISRQSASASEIFAGAIQDYERGLIVGDDHTFGKGTVQNLNDIGEKLGATKVTISKFYRPSGSSTQLKGVESDVVFPSLIQALDIGEKFYDYALQWDKINLTPYKGKGQVKPYVETLAKNSKLRVEKDPGFKDIAEEIKDYEKNKSERSRVSLNEKNDEDKNKKGDKDKKKKAEEEESSEELNLSEDFQLQESIRVAADYSQLLNKRKTGALTIPQLSMALAENKKKSDDKRAKAKIKEANTSKPNTGNNN